MARLAPDRVERLILIATSARPRPDRRAAIAPTGYRGVTRTAIRNSLAPANKDDASMVDRIRRMSISLGQDVFARQIGFQYSGDGDHLSDIRWPTLIVAGSEDRLRTLEEAEELRDGIPGSRLTVLPVGHMMDLSRICAAPDARLGHLAFEG